MTRRPRKVRSAPKPLRRAIKKARPAKQPHREPLDEFIVQAGRALDIEIEKSWLPAVRGHLQITLRLGALVADFALPDDAEPAPVFEA